MMVKRGRLPELPCASCRLTNENDDGEDFGPVQPADAVQAQRQHAVDPLQRQEKERRARDELSSETWIHLSLNLVDSVHLEPEL